MLKASPAEKYVFALLKTLILIGLLGKWQTEGPCNHLWGLPFPFFQHFLWALPRRTFEINLDLGNFPSATSEEKCLLYPVMMFSFFLPCLTWSQRGATAAGCVSERMWPFLLHSCLCCGPMLCLDVFCKLVPPWSHYGSVLLFQSRRSAPRCHLLTEGAVIFIILW